MRVQNNSKRNEIYMYKTILKEFHKFIILL